MKIRLERAAMRSLAEAARLGRDCIIVSVNQSQGSTPREPGAAMLVGADHVTGTIGGGHLELKAIALAREMLSAPPGAARAPVVRRFALGPSLGQCCGGVAYVRFDACENGVPPAGLQVATAASLFTLYLFGAGHVGRALVQVLATVECDVVWVDAREQEFPDRIPANVRIEHSDHPPDEVDAAPAGAFHLVMTHSHALDLAIIERVLRRGDAGFAGLIGSRTKRATFERRLAERGIEARALEGLVCPIGLAGVKGKAPGVVAIAVAAEMLWRAGMRDRHRSGHSTARA